MEYLVYPTVKWGKSPLLLNTRITEELYTQYVCSKTWSAEWYYYISTMLDLQSRPELQDYELISREDHDKNSWIVFYFSGAKML